MEKITIKKRIYGLIRLLENEGIDKGLRECYRGQLMAYYDVIKEDLKEDKKVKIKNVLGWM